MVALVAAALLVTGCSRAKAPTTAQAFVEAYAQAHRDEKVNRILDLQWETRRAPASSRSGTPLGEEFDPVLREQEGKRLADDFRRGDMWTKAWKQTRYAGEEDRGNFIHVDVEVMGAGSSIVLVKGEDGQLFITLNPSDYE